MKSAYAGQLVGLEDRESMLDSIYKEQALKQQLQDRALLEQQQRAGLTQNQSMQTPPAPSQTSPLVKESARSRLITEGLPDFAKLALIGNIKGAEDYMNSTGSTRVVSGSTQYDQNTGNLMFTDASTGEQLTINKDMVDQLTGQNKMNKLNLAEAEKRRKESESKDNEAFRLKQEADLMAWELGNTVVYDKATKQERPKTAAEMDFDKKSFQQAKERYKRASGRVSVPSEQSAAQEPAAQPSGLVPSSAVNFAETGMEKGAGLIKTNDGRAIAILPGNKKIIEGQMANQNGVRGLIIPKRKTTNDGRAIAILPGNKKIIEGQMANQNGVRGLIIPKRKTTDVSEVPGTMPSLDMAQRVMSEKPSNAPVTSLNQMENQSASSVPVETPYKTISKPEEPKISPDGYMGKWKPTGVGSNVPVISQPTEKKTESSTGKFKEGEVREKNGIKYQRDSKGNWSAI